MIINKMQAIGNDRFYIAAVLSAAAFVVTFGAYLIYSSPLQEPDFETKKASDMLACTSFAEHKGLTVEPEGRSVLTLTKNSFDDPKFTFSMIESVILACDNIEFKTFCMGIKEQCGLDGTKVVLTYESPKVY